MFTPPARCSTCAARLGSAFQNASASALGLIDELRDPMVFAAGEDMPFARNGRVGFFCVASGHSLITYARARVTRPLRVCGSGDLVGYGNWHWDERCRASALEPSGACFFEREPFEAFAHARPAIVAVITRLESLVILQKSERIASLAHPSVKARVAATLLALDQKFGAKDANGSRLSARIPRSTLAALSGTVVESLSRALTELEDDEVISRTGRTLVVRDATKLEQISYGPARRRGGEHHAG